MKLIAETEKDRDYNEISPVAWRDSAMGRFELGYDSVNDAYDGLDPRRIGLAGKHTTAQSVDPTGFARLLTHAWLSPSRNIESGSGISRDILAASGFAWGESRYRI